MRLALVLVSFRAGPVPILNDLTTPFMSRHLDAALVLTLGLACGAGASDAPAGRPATPEGWRAAALRDIQAGFEVTLAKHAGARDPHNPAFLGKLERAKEQALALAAGVADAGGYHATLLRFSASSGTAMPGSIPPSTSTNSGRPAGPASWWPGAVTCSCMRPKVTRHRWASASCPATARRRAP